MLKLLKKYNLIIYYNSKKKNNKVDILSKINNFIKTKIIFNYGIIKASKNNLSLMIKYKLSISIYIIKND